MVEGVCSYRSGGVVARQGVGLAGSDGGGVVARQRRMAKRWRREQHERTSKTHGAEPQNQNKGSSSSLSSKDTSLEEDNYSVNHGGEAASRKRGRVSWKHIHPLFVNAVNQLGGPDNAKPRRIIEIMKVPGLTRAHARSHLQKYRNGLKRIEEEQQNYSVSDMNGSLFPIGPHLYNYHRAHQPIQIQIQPPEKNTNNFGHLVPAPSSSYYIATTGGANNDGIINQKQAPGTSFGSNMPQQPQIGTCFGSNQNLTYGVPQPDQDPASGSTPYATTARGANNDGAISQHQAICFRGETLQQPQIS
ncbi:hypothetical protein K1719_003293 [Acacia pycnantha]|nr:hypothetical protein K1719_003293 [Acacia pycnantha]